MLNSTYNNPNGSLPSTGVGTPTGTRRRRTSTVGIRLGLPLVVAMGLLIAPLSGARAHVAPGSHAKGTGPQIGAVVCQFPPPPQGTPQPIGTPPSGTGQSTGPVLQGSSSACQLPPGCLPGGAGIPPSGTPEPIGTPSAGGGQSSGEQSSGGQSIVVSSSDVGQEGGVIVSTSCRLPLGCGFVPLLKVTSVSGNTITGTGLGSSTVTITVDSATTYSEAEAPATLSDVQPGSHIAASGTCSQGGSMHATAVTIVLPQVMGVVTAVNGSTLTMTGVDAIVHTINVDSATRYQRAGQSAALSDISTGALINAEGTKGSDGSLHAALVRIQLPHLAGNVTAVNSNSISITTADGSTATVVTSASTTYDTKTAKSATASSITTGAFIVAEGTLSADESTLTAVRVSIMPRFPVGGMVTSGDLAPWAT